jgi:hypothetical protein
VIPNITRGGRVGGLLRYLTGPGRENEHVNPRVVAGDPAAMAVWGEADLSFADHGAAVLELAEHLDHPRLRSPTRVTVAVKDPAGDPTGTRKDAHVWHCSLSLHPDEPALDDEQWAQIAEEFVATMGFAGGDSDGRCRWVAIRHGLSKGGNDHIHVVVQLVNEHGRAASVHLDRPRAQTCARELEQTHGLRPVEGRDRGRGVRATNRRQRERAAQDHDRNALRYPSPEADRDVLERVVRQAAAAAASEAEFVRTIRAADHERYLIRPRFAAGRDDQVVGYSVALQPTEPGRQPVWHAGGKLAKDLTLPTLRTRWNAGPADQDAISEWQRAWHNQPPVQQHGPAAGAADHQWQLAVEELRALRAQLDVLPPGERGAWADAAAQGAAVFHGWAHLAPEHATALRSCGDQLARSAQLPAHELQAARVLPRARGIVMLCAAAMRPRNQLLYWLVLAQELTALTQAVSDMHQAAGEAQRAAQLASALRHQLQPVHDTLQNTQSDPLAARMQRASQAPDASRRDSVADDAATEAQRLGRAGQQDPSPQPPPANQPTGPPPRPSTPPSRTVRRGR